MYIPLAVLVLAGSIPGAFLLKNVDARAIKLVFGVVVVALGAEMLSREYSKKRVPSSRLVWQPGFCAVSLVWALCWPLTSIAWRTRTAHLRQISARSLLWTTHFALFYTVHLDYLRLIRFCPSWNWFRLHFWGCFWESNAAIIWMEKMLRRLHRYCWYCPVFRWFWKIFKNAGTMQEKK